MVERENTQESAGRVPCAYRRYEFETSGVDTDVPCPLRVRRRLVVASSGDAYSARRSAVRLIPRSRAVPDGGAIRTHHSYRDCRTEADHGAHTSAISPYDCPHVLTPTDCTEGCPVFEAASRECSPAKADQYPTAPAYSDSYTRAGSADVHCHRGIHDRKPAGARLDGVQGSEVRSLSGRGQRVGPFRGDRWWGELASGEVSGHAGVRAGLAPERAAPSTRTFPDAHS